MTDATYALRQAGAAYEQKTDFHLKVEAYNFWPGTGTIVVDGETQRRKEKGLSAFILILRDAGLAGIP